MPINGMTRAARAMHYLERRQEVVANNLANVDTNGFKAERVFAQMLEGEITVAGAATDFRAGALKETGSPLDLAIGGDGFFVIDSPNGERITRGGSFQLDADGQIVDPHGNPLLGEGGPIIVPPGSSVDVSNTGLVTADGEEIGRIRLESVPAGTVLEHAGGTQFLPSPDRTPVETADRSIKQGYLEDSNVSPISSMVDMIGIQRAYAAMQRTVSALDGVRERIANDLGRPV